MKIQLSWLQLKHEKIRFVVALAGIAFADLLMFIQLGFRDALFDSNIKFHQNLDGDIFLISPQSNASVTMKPFSRRRLYQAQSIEGVESAAPIYMDFAIWKNPENQKTRGLLVFGVNPEKNPINLPGLSKKLDVIKQRDFYLFDELSRSEFGNIAQLLQSNSIVKTEMEDKKIRIGGLFSLGASFAADGNLVTSDTNFLRLFPQRDLSLIDIAVIQLKPDVDVAQTKAIFKEFLPNDILVFSQEEFIQFEREYWQTSTAIGFIFGMGVSIGFIVGILIVYQILYTDISDHLPQYATLKAIGYRNHYFIFVILQEATILAVLAYFPGVSISALLYSLAANATNLPIIMTVNRAVFVFILTLIMCFASGLIAMRKLNSADPADIF